MTDHHRPVAPGIEPAMPGIEPARIRSCWLCGIRLPTSQMVPDGGSACPDLRWYCKDTWACTQRWTSHAARLASLRQTTVQPKTPAAQPVRTPAAQPVRTPAAPAKAPAAQAADEDAARPVAV